MNSETPDQTSEGGSGLEARATFGKQLRRAREERGISLREISEHTRITMRHLEAIEADKFKHLPGGIFNESFIKAYAALSNLTKRARSTYMRERRASMANQ